VCPIQATSYKLQVAGFRFQAASFRVQAASFRFQGSGFPAKGGPAFGGKPVTCNLKLETCTLVERCG